MSLDRTPRRPAKATSFVTGTLARNLVLDPRFAGLKISCRYVLLIAALNFTDARGWFWPKVRVLAQTAGVHRSTVVDALGAAAKVGLVTRQPHARPDGMQGSSTYQFDALLMPDDKVVGNDDNRGRQNRPADKVVGNDDSDKVVAETAHHRVFIEKNLRAAEERNVTSEEHERELKPPASQNRRLGEEPDRVLLHLIEDERGMGYQRPDLSARLRGIYIVRPELIVTSAHIYLPGDQ